MKYLHFNSFLIAAILILSSLDLSANGKYVLDWQYQVPNLNADIKNIWLIDNDSTIFANVYKDDSFFLNVNTQKVNRILKNQQFDGFQKKVSYDGKTIYAFAHSIFKVDAKSGEILDNYDYFNGNGSCLCYDLFMTRDENMYLTAYYGDGQISYYSLRDKKYIKDISTNFGRNGRSVNQVYMTKDGSKLIYIQEYRMTNPDKSVKELRITDTANTKELLLIPASKFAVSDDETLLAYCNSTSEQDKLVTLIDLKSLSKLDSFKLPPPPTEKYITPPHLAAPINFVFSKDNSLLSIGSSYGSLIFDLIQKKEIPYINGTMNNLRISNDNMYLYFSSTYDLYRYKRDTTTNVESDLQKIDLQITPNPANYNLKLSYFSPKTAKTVISLIDMSGSNLTTLFQGESNFGLNEHNFNLNQISKGSYAIQISIDGVVYFKNFIKE